MPNWVTFPSTIAFRPFQARAVCSIAAGVLDESGVSEGYRFKRTIQGCSFVVVRSCEEFEAKWLHLLLELFRKPIIPVGFFTPLPLHQGEEEDARWRTFVHGSTS